MCAKPLGGRNLKKICGTGGERLRESGTPKTRGVGRVQKTGSSWNHSKDFSLSLKRIKKGCNLGMI